MEEPPKKYFRLFPGNEVRLMGAYFVTAVSCEKDSDGNVTVVHCTYDPETKGGNSPDGRKVKGTIHWVSAADAIPVDVRLYENLIDEEKANEMDSIYDENGELVITNCYDKDLKAYVEPALKDAKAFDRFQFVRQGFFCVDYKDSKEGSPVFNRIVSLKSSFVLPKQD